MKILFRVVGLIITLLVTVIMLENLPSESGEIVVIATHDATGVVKKTRLWIVDHDGTA